MIKKSIQTQDTLREYTIILPFAQHLFCAATDSVLLFIFTWQFWRENIPLLLETKYTEFKQAAHTNLPENTFEGGAEECSHYRRTVEKEGELVLRKGVEIRGNIREGEAASLPTVQIRIQNATDVIGQ